MSAYVQPRGETVELVARNPKTGYKKSVRFSMSSLYASPDEFVHVTTKFLEEASMEMFGRLGSGHTLESWEYLRKDPSAPLPRQLSHRSVPWDWSPEADQHNQGNPRREIPNEKRDLSEPPFEYSYAFQKRRKT